MRNATNGNPVFFIALVLACLAGVPDNAAAAGNTRTVSSLNDDGATNTLRFLIAASGPNDTIDFSVSGTIILLTGEIGIGRNLTINGPSATSVIVSGNNSSRVFNISGGVVNISRLTIANGRIVGTSGMPPTAGSGAGNGGGILNQGTLNLGSCTFVNNAAIGGSGGSSVNANASDPGWAGGIGTGGAIANQGTLNATNCTFSNNTAAGGQPGHWFAEEFGNGGSANGGAVANGFVLN